MSLPLLFTLPPSNRHEIILVDTTVEGKKKPTLKALNQQITKAMAASPNCEEFMAKHKSASAKESIVGLKMHWSGAARDRKIWPEYTIITDENWSAVLEILKNGGGGVGKGDVLEVKMGKEEKDE